MTSGVLSPSSEEGDALLSGAGMVAAVRVMCPRVGQKRSNRGSSLLNNATMLPTANAARMVPSRTPYKAPEHASETAAATTTLVQSKATLTLGNAILVTRDIAKLMPSPGRVRKLAFTCRNTPNAVMKPGDLQRVVSHGDELAERHECIDKCREYENVGYLQQLHGVEVATHQGDLDQHEDDVHDKGPRANGERGEI